MVAENATKEGFWKFQVETREGNVRGWLHHQHGDSSKQEEIYLLLISLRPHKEHPAYCLSENENSNKAGED